MFSWYTSDTKERIVADETQNIIMTGIDERVFDQKEAYEGYGIFGGKDFFEYLAEINNLGSDRDAGIELTYDVGGSSGSLKQLEAKGYHSPRLLADSRNVRTWYKFDPPEDDPYQGMRDEDDFFEDTILVSEDVKIGNIILEKGDKIIVLKKGTEEA